MLYLNYPNNPTGAVAGRAFYESVVAFARRHGIIVCSDATYCEQYGEQKPISIFEVEGAREVGIEFHSLSKMYRMSKWRIGFAVGDRNLIEAFWELKSHTDLGLFQAVQSAGVAALEGDQRCVSATRKICRDRRRALVAGLKRIGWDVASAEAAFHVWVAVPRKYDSVAFSKMMLDEAGIFVIPGVCFGEGGEGYVRFALIQDRRRTNEALRQLEKLNVGAAQRPARFL